MSLDGFVADADGGVAEVFDWYFAGDVPLETGGSSPMTFMLSEPDAAYVRDLTAELGAVLTGRTTFDAAQGWGGNHAWGPGFVVTHEVPDGWPREGSSLTFVTDGVESAARQAKAAAGDKAVGVHGADTIQQLLDAGLVDELLIDVSAVLLGSGVRLFDRLDNAPMKLGDPSVVQGVGVTHLRYSVPKS
jgi:dihydrofolate reductase